MAENDGPDESVPEGAAVMPEIPAALGISPLFLAVLHAVIFLEGSEDDVVDGEAALEALNYMGTYLQRLPAADVQRLREDLQALVAYGKDQDWPRENIRFFKEFLENFGVGEESTE